MKKYKNKIVTKKTVKIGDIIRRYSKGGTPRTFEVYMTNEGLYPFCADMKKYIYYKIRKVRKVRTDNLTQSILKDFRKKFDYRRTTGYQGDEAIPAIDLDEVEQFLVAQLQKVREEERKIISEGIAIAMQEHPELKTVIGGILYFEDSHSGKEGKG